MSIIVCFFPRTISLLELNQWCKLGETVTITDYLRAKQLNNLTIHKHPQTM